jgi:hypothetical protein
MAVLGRGVNFDPCQGPAGDGALHVGKDDGSVRAARMAADGSDNFGSGKAYLRSGSSTSGLIGADSGNGSGGPGSFTSIGREGI